MARIRSSKPEWWKSAKWCRLSRDVRSTYKGIWEVMCDDFGRFSADVRNVKAEVWPLDDDITPKKLAGWLRQLAEVEITLPEEMGGGKAPAIQFYVVDGITYGYLAGFVEHQKISHKAPSKLPSPPSLDTPKSPEDDRSGSGGTPENLRPEEEGDVDLDLDVEVEKDVERDLEKSGEASIKPDANGSSPRVLLPREAYTFLAQFYEPAFTDKAKKRYRDVEAQLRETLDPLHPGPKIRGGIRVKARSLEHLVSELRHVSKDPPPDRDLAIVWLLKRLTNAPKGPTDAEREDKKQREQIALEERYSRAAKAAGIDWANANAEEYSRIVKAVNAHFTTQGKGGLIKLAKEAELTQRCAKAAGFPDFDTWAANRRSKSHPMSETAGAASS